MSIVAFHLSYQTDDWLFMFSSWGAPVVSIFYFISGYGLAFNYRARGNEYLSHFFKHRILGNLILPFLLVWIVNRIVSGNISMSLLDELIELLMHGETTLPYSWYVFSILLFLHSLLYDSCQAECCNHFIPLCLYIYSSYRFIEL